MGTKIEWASLGLPRRESWNPIGAVDIETGKRGWFCIKKNEACRECYAESMNRGRLGNGLRYAVPDLARVRLELYNIDQPRHWRIPRGIFTCSMTDLFGEFISDEMRDKVMDTVDAAHWHRFALLTKRAEQPTLDYLTARYAERPFPRHTWFGISIGNQAHADQSLWFMQKMRDLVGPDVVLWVSHGPAIGAVDWSGWEFIDWLATEGESGPRARPMHPAWPRADRNWCIENGIAWYFKQWGQWTPHLNGSKPPDTAHAPKKFLRLEPDGVSMRRVARKKDAGRKLDGEVWEQFPARP